MEWTNLMFLNIFWKISIFGSKKSFEPIIITVNRILNGTIKSGKYVFNLDWLNIDQVQFKNHLTVFYCFSYENYFISKCSSLKWVAYFRWSSLYCAKFGQNDHRKDAPHFNWPFSDVYLCWRCIFFDRQSLFGWFQPSHYRWRKPKQNFCGFLWFFVWKFHCFQLPFSKEAESHILNQVTPVSDKQSSPAIVFQLWVVTH